VVAVRARPAGPEGPPYTPATQPRLSSALGEDVDLFSVIRQGDVLVHHPYDSFTSSVQAFVDAAARDEQVLAIKITLYRTSGPNSPIVRSLIQAAEEGKQVVVLVELKARFDEEANIEWARALEEAGAHVAYGVVGLKTHTKIALVVRNEDGTIRRYAHVGTGNYNEETARVYEDIGVLTADPAIGADLTDLFNLLTGYSRQQRYQKLLIAPTTLRPRILELIAREADAPDGEIVLKLNSLVDPEVIEALYAASCAQTSVRLIVRGICCLRPGVTGMSENVSVRSLVGRYLEHSRIYRFGSPARGYDHLIGSADLMPRNLNRRVEAVTPIDDPALQQRLDEVLEVLFTDDVLAWTMHPDGSWRRTLVGEGIDAQERLQDLALGRSRMGRVDEGLEVVRAAGGVVLRPGPDGGPPEVLIVHRPRYDDWSLPKGKLDPGEAWLDAALREVHEETGVTTRTDRELAPTSYTDRSGHPKKVRWWRMRPIEGHPVDRPGDREIDLARWVTVEVARRKLTYDTDRSLLEEALEDGSAT
jgi:polyphosphate kinase